MWIGCDFDGRGKVIRSATGYLGPNGGMRGRPLLRDHAKRQMTLRSTPM